MRTGPAKLLLSAVLTASLLALNFTVVTVKAMPDEVPASAEDASPARSVTLAVLLREAHDSQDPETTACRCAFRQVIRMGEPLSALLSLAGTLPRTLSSYGSAGTVSLAGASVPRNAERIAAFLHDLASPL